MMTVVVCALSQLSVHFGVSETMMIVVVCALSETTAKTAIYRPPIAAKFCIMLGSIFSFITPVQKFGGLPSKKIGGGRKTR